MTPADKGGARRRQLRVRRLPDARGWLRTHKQYEVASFPAGSDEPEWVRATEHPGSVLRSEGVHSTDVHDYVAQADRAWDGGTGEWRSGFPSEND
jgi:hypothetical protein